MKFNWKSTAASLAVLIGISGVAFGADRDDRPDRDHRAPVAKHDDHDRDHDNRNKGRVIVPDNRRVYNNGWYGDRDRRVDNANVYNNRAYSPYYGNSGYYGTGYGNTRVSGNAAQIGYQDGINDGRNDRVTGHSFRPTQDDNYKDASRGYSSAFGDKQSYKNTYRQGYEQGYQQGYGR
jgi:hypothetical protein